LALKALSRRAFSVLKSIKSIKNN